MGKTSKPLSILLTTNRMWDWPGIRELSDKGHTVVTLTNVVSAEEWDLVLGPNCWLMDEAHKPYLKQAVEAARKRRYPR